MSSTKLCLTSFFAFKIITTENDQVYNKIRKNNQKNQNQKNQNQKKTKKKSLLSKKSKMEFRFSGSRFNTI